MCIRDSSVDFGALVDLQSLQHEFGTLSIDGTLLSDAATVTTGDVNVGSTGVVSGSDATFTLLGDLIGGSNLDFSDNDLVFTANGISQVVSAIAFQARSVRHEGDGTLVLQTPTTISDSLVNVSGTLDIPNSSVTAADFVLQSGSLTSSSGGGSLSIANLIELQSGSAAVPLSGSATFEKTGSSEVRLSATSSHTGDTNVREGILLLDVDSALPAATDVLIESDGTLDNGGFDWVVSSVVNQGQLNLSGDINVSVRIGDLINETTGLIVSTASLIQISGNLDNNGSASLGDGQLEFDSETTPQSLRSGGATLGNVLHSGAATLGIDDATNITGDLVNASGQLDINGQSVTAGQFVLESGAIVDSADVGQITSLAPHSLRQGSVDATLAGTAGLEKSTEAVVTIGGVQQLSGVILVSQGRLELLDSASLDGEASVNVTANAELDLQPAEIRVTAITGQGTISLNSTTLTIEDTVDSLFAGDITGQGNLNKVGSGNLTLAGTNSIEGMVQIENGTVTLASNASLPATISIQVGVDGTLDLQDTQHELASLSIAGSLRSDSAEVLIGSLEVLSSGSVSSVESLFRFQGDVASDVALDFSTNDLVFDGGGEDQFAVLPALSARSLLHEGNGTLSVSASMIDLSTLTNQSGTLDINDTSIDTIDFILTSGEVTSSTSDGEIDVSDQVEFRSGTVSAVLSGQADILKTSSGETLIETPLSLAGTIQVDEGTLTASVSNAIPNGADVTIESIGRLNTVGFDVIFGDVTTRGILEITGGVTNSARFNDLLIEPSGGIVSELGLLEISGNLQNQGSAILGDGVLDFVSENTDQFVSLPSTTIQAIRHSGTATLFLQSDLTVDSEFSMQAGTIQLDGNRIEAETVVVQGGVINDTTGSGEIFSTQEIDLQQGTITASLRSDEGLRKSSAGSVLLGAEQSINGPLVIQEGVLELLPEISFGQPIAVQVETPGMVSLQENAELNLSSLEGDGELLLQNATVNFGVESASQAVLQWSGETSGTGTINKLGVNTLLFLGDSTFSGDVNVVDGLVSVDGLWSQANITVLEGATVGGDGFIDRLTVNANGHLRPGNSPGRLTVNELTMQQGAILGIEIDGVQSSASHDVLEVLGSAVFAGEIELEIADPSAFGDDTELRPILFGSGEGGFVNQSEPVDGFTVSMEPNAFVVSRIHRIRQLYSHLSLIHI